MSEWFSAGEPLASVSIDDRGFQYGDGLFETVAIRHGGPRLWGYHIDRLTDGCERLRISTPDAQALRMWLDSALHAATADSTYCVAKIVHTSGIGQRGYGRETPTPGATYIGVFPSVPPAASMYRDGVDAIICDTRLATGSATAALKTLNRIEQVLARTECRAAGTFEGLTLDADERLICGTMSNVFLVRKDSLVTPSLSRCGVAGVMRRHVIDVWCECGREVVERDVDMRDLRKASEIFLSNSQFGVLPVARFDDVELPVGPITREVMGLLAESGIDECRA